MRPDRRHLPPVLACLVAVGAARSAEPATPSAEFLAYPESATSWTILKGTEGFLDLRIVGWGPGWSWMGFDGTVEERDGESLARSTAKVPGSDAELALVARARKAGPCALELELELKASKDTDLTMVVAAVELPAKRFAAGKARVVAADGSRREVSLPLEKKGLGETVRAVSLVDAGGRTTEVRLAPPRPVPSDGAARIVLAQDALEASEPARVAISIELPAALSYRPSSSRVAADLEAEAWYEFRPSAEPGTGSEIGLEGWIDGPAGKRGRIERKDDASSWGPSRSSPSRGSRRSTSRRGNETGTSRARGLSSSSPWRGPGTPG